MTTAHLPIRRRARLAGKMEGYVSYSRRRRSDASGGQNSCMVPRSRQRSIFYSTNRNLLVVIFIGKPIRRTDIFLNRDTGAWGSDHDE